MQSSRRTISNSVVIHRQIVRTLSSKISPDVRGQENQLKIKPWHEIPGPSAISSLIYIVFHKLLPHSSDTYTFSEVYKQYGPIVKLKGVFGAPNIVFLFDAEAVSQIYRHENWMPIRVGFQALDYFRKKHNRSSKDLVTGLITDQGELWKNFRTTVNPIMLQPKTIKLYKTSLNEVAEDTIKRLRLLRNENNIIEGNFEDEMNLWALESIAVVALGGRLNCLDPILPDDSAAKQLLETIHGIFKTTEEIDFKPNIWRYVSTPLFRKAMKLFETQVELSKFFIKKAIEQLENRDKNVTEEKGVLEKLLEIDENIAVIMASDMLFAGVDTVSNTITPTLYLLAQNPEKQNKLREEILSRNDKQAYLKACIKESMRLSPVAAGNLRVTTKDYDILGYRIPKDTYVSFGHQVLSTMEEHFPRANEYIPERWITDKTDPIHYSNAHPFAFNPFGFGVRSCIGRRIAELEIETLITKIIENFYVEWFGPSLKIRASTLNYTEAPYNFIFKDVK